MYARGWQRLGAALVLTGLISACVETKVSIRMQKDGTGEAAVEQFIPNVMLDGKLNGTQIFDIQKNDLLLRDEKEARSLMGDRSGVRVLNFESKDVKADPVPGAPIPSQGGRATRTLVAFEHIEALGTHHFSFAVIPDGADQYFVFRIGKTLRENYVDKSNGGMGPVLSAMLAGRYLTFNVELPSRVLATNATSTQWNVVEWKIPLGAIYNLVQDEILGWAKISGSEGITLDKMRETVLQTLPGNDWRNPKKFAPYFLLPTEEPAPRPPQKTNTVPTKVGPGR